MIRKYYLTDIDFRNKLYQIYNDYIISFNTTIDKESKISDLLVIKSEIDSRIETYNQTLLQLLSDHVRSVPDNPEVENLSEKDEERIIHALYSDFDNSTEWFYSVYNELSDYQRDHLKIIADNFYTVGYYYSFNYPSVQKYSISPNILFDAGNKIINLEAQLNPINQILDAFLNEYKKKLPTKAVNSQTEAELIEANNFSQTLIDMKFKEFINSKESEKSKYWTKSNGPHNGAIIVKNVADYILFDLLKKDENDVSLKTIVNRINESIFALRYLPKTKKEQFHKKKN